MTICEKKTYLIELNMILNDLVFHTSSKNTNFAS